MMKVTPGTRVDNKLDIYVFITRKIQLCWKNNKEHHNKRCWEWFYISIWTSCLKVPMEEMFEDTKGVIRRHKRKTIPCLKGQTIIYKNSTQNIWDCAWWTSL